MEGRRKIYLAHVKWGSNTEVVSFQACCRALAKRSSRGLLRSLHQASGGEKPCSKFMWSVVHSTVKSKACQVNSLCNTVGRHGKKDPSLESYYPSTELLMSHLHEEPSHCLRIEVFNATKPRAPSCGACAHPNFRNQIGCRATISTQFGDHLLIVAPHSPSGS